jgi:hypothetical protein
LDDVGLDPIHQDIGSDRNQLAGAGDLPGAATFGKYLQTIAAATS